MDVKYPHSDFIVIKKQVAKTAIACNRFIELLNKALNSVYVKGSTDYLKSRTAIEVIKKYFEDYKKVKSIVPDELFFRGLKKDMETDFFTLDDKPYTENTIQQIVSYTRRLINLYMVPKGIIKRKLFQEQIFAKFEKMLNLTQNTQRGLVYFENQGTGTKGKEIYLSGGEGEIKSKFFYTVTNKGLSSTLKYARISRVLAILDYCSKQGIEQITKEDLENYSRKGCESAHRDLSEARNVFINLKVAGFIKNNPFNSFQPKKIVYDAKIDFIAIEGINKIKDLSTMDYKNNLQVRDRLICLLLYDTAIRKNECLSLKHTDIVKEADGMVRVILRGKTQKGDKNTIPLYLYFDETKKLLEHYLNKTRKLLNPKEDNLFISELGNPLSSSRLRRIVKEHCKKLNIKTFYNQEPSPHVMRHSFCTLNIAPLGPFPLDGIVERLRHIGYATAKKHYIHNNPYLQKLKHKEYQKNGKNSSIYDRISLDDVKTWLKGIGLQEETLQLVSEKHKEFFSIDKDSTDVVRYMLEKKVLSKIADFNISINLLRRYCLKKGLCKKKRESVNQKYDYQYKEDFVNDLINNWLPMETALKKFKISRTVFYRGVKKQKFQTLKIGILLVRIQDLILGV